MSRKRSMTKSDWNRRKKEILAWKVPKNAEKKVFTDGVIVNIYDTAGRLLWRYERYWNVIGRFAEGDYRYSKRWTIVNKKDTIFKYIFWERLDSLPIPECCFHFIWC